MRKNNIIKVLLLCCLFWVNLKEVRAADLAGQSIIPVEWQAIRLQENIEEKIKRSLTPIIRPEDYVIEVKIGVDTEKSEDPSSKKITKTTQRKKIKFTTADAPRNGDDFVVFNKIGLEAPIVGEEPVEMETSDVELAQKAMIEINDRYNLFNFLMTIDINLTFDKNLSLKTKDSIQKVIKGLSFNTKDIVPQINIQYIDLKGAKVLIDPVKSETQNLGANKDQPRPGALDRFKNLDIMMGLIVSALLLACAMIFIAQKGSKSKVEEEAKNENENKDEVEALNEDQVLKEDEFPAENIEEELEDEQMNLDLTKTDPMTVKINEGLDRFRKILNHHYNDMALLVKSWIKSAKGEEAAALKALVQLLSDNELTLIFKCLNNDERATWKMCLSGDLKKDELCRAYHFISNQIIQMMMVPSLIDDYEICDLLLAMRTEDAARYAEKNIELGVLFANILGSKTIGEMFKLLPVEASMEIIERSAYFKKEDILAKMPLLKTTMLEFKERRERPPFIKRIVDILPSARPELEKKLYATLLKHLSAEDVKDVALTYFPGDLVTVVPDSIYKEAVALMPTEIQIQYFVSLTEDEREEGLNRYAAKGSKSRDIIELELQSILRNEMLVSRIRNEKRDSLQGDFLGFVRKYLEETPSVKKEISGLVETYLKEIREAEEGSSQSLAA